MAERGTAGSETCFVSCSQTSRSLVTENVCLCTDFVCVYALVFYFFLNVPPGSGALVFSAHSVQDACGIDKPQNFIFTLSKSIEVHKCFSISARRVQKFALPPSWLRKGGVLLLPSCFSEESEPIVFHSNPKR